MTISKERYITKKAESDSLAEHSIEANICKEV